MQMGVAVKLERRTEQRVVLMNMIMQGVSMMSQLTGPRWPGYCLSLFGAACESLGVSVVLTHAEAEFVSMRSHQTICDALHRR
ncbi:protein MotC [Alcaligenes faecalis subsp. faecalis NCIB 8687]|nr:protein MotC [Alcaligenes faecalis subsp. faecalis NCIB 8687]